MTSEALNFEFIRRSLAPLLETGQAELSSLAIEASLLAELGFQVNDGVVSVPDGIELLDPEIIFSALSERARRWITDFEILPVVDSTNTRLNALASNQSIHGVVRLAELQVQGRGRRGRAWQSPYANNLALSVGARLPQSLDELGGLSLCTGLAVADHLLGAGVSGIQLKWPNDVLLNGAKVAGILVELHAGPAGSEIVVGIGLNFSLPAAVRAAFDQPVTDLAETGQRFSRNQTAGGVISSLVDFIDGFSEHGFEPMREMFNRLHRFHEQQCALLLGSHRLVGLVRGVDTRGELLLEIDGQVRAFNAGEVSLRPV